MAEAIGGAGLEAYYERRSNPGRPGARADTAVDPDLAVLDTPAYQATVTQRRADGTREVSLLLDGVTCAACIWLIERRLQSLTGIVEASVNFSTQRAYVRWQEGGQRLSGIVGAIRTIGYDAEPFDAQRADMRRRRETRTSLWRLFVAAFGMMQVMMYAVPTYMADGDMTPDIEGLLRWASLVLTLPVIGFSAVPFFNGALRDMRARTVGMDVPVALGIVVAFVASVRATFSGIGEVYFDSITMFVFLLLGARHLEAVLRARAGEATERLGRLLPAFATRIRLGAQGETVQRVAVAELMRGDRVAVAAGEIVPADGTVETGTSEVDESLLTGESRRVAKQPDAALIGGSVNITSRIVMRVERIGGETVVAGIGRLLDRASSDKPRVAQLADRVAAQFVVAILGIAALAGLGWWFVDPQQALPIAVTVLVITCPCALSLATPAALAAANGSLTRLGVLITRGHALETLAKATHFVFDKTGTLTTGELDLAAVTPLGVGDASSALGLAVAMERDSRHPIARALLLAAGGQHARETIRGLDGARDVAGRGIEGVFRGRRVRIGTADFVAELTGTPVPRAVEDVAEHLQAVVLGGEDGWIALFTLNDQLRAQARTLIASLQAHGREVALLTGDRAIIARYTARELGIDTVQAGARPEDKHRYVRDLQDRGAIVAMIGDGVNDAPVLAQAQVSVAMGSGADLARASADVILGDSALERLQDILDVARKTRRVITENLLWATLYNIIAIPAAVAGMVTPLMASVGMAASSIIVVANALRAAHPALWQRVRAAPSEVEGLSPAPRPSVNSA